MEEVTQSFCLAGETDIIDILCDNVNGQNIVHWVDIEQIFPGVKYVKRGNIAVTFMKDPHLTRSIKHYPGVVLDVVLSTSDGNEPTTVRRTNNSTNATLRQQNLPSDDEDDTNSTLLPNQVVKYVQRDAIESDVEQLLVTFPPSDSQSKVLTSSTPDALVQAIKGGHLNRLGEQMIVRLQDLKDGVTKNNELASKNNELASKINGLVLENNQVGYKNKELLLENNQVAHENKELLIRLNDLQNVLDSKQDEMKELQIQALDRLALIQNSVKALLMQTYELHEYPIPRLFIVLPDEKSSWDPLNFFSNKFRLYFLCECGEHTMATNSKIPHHIHLAKHEGYDIDRPSEFFQQYGSYVLTILRMLKFGITVAGVAIPVLSQLVRVDGFDQATETLRLLTKTIEPGMDQVIKHIDKASADGGSGVVVGFSEQMENNEALEGADLRQLESFLKIKDSNRVLGNLYRTVTGEGHVKWVCIDHFRENYHAKAAQAFRETVDTLQGTFDENLGRAEVTLPSRVLAEQFYRVLGSAKSVYELKVVLDWDITQSDFKVLRNILPKTSVGVLELYLTRQDVRTRDFLGRSQPYDSILDIMQLRSIQSFAIRGPCDFTKRSNLLLSRKYEFPNLRHLDISLDQLQDDNLGVKCLITKCSNLSSFTLGSSARSAQVSLGETVVDLIIPPTLRHLDVPLYLLKYDIPGVKRLITNASCLSRLDLRIDALGSDNDYVLQAYNAIAEHRAYSINFTGWDLCLPPPPRESNQSLGARQCMEHVLKYYCTVTDAQDLSGIVRKLFRNAIDSFWRSSDEAIGRVEVKLKSSVQAEHIYFALTKARSVHELRVELDWEATESDIEKLYATLATTNAGVLELYLAQQYGSARDRLNRDQLYGPIVDIMGRQSTQSFTFIWPRDPFHRSILLSRNKELSDSLHLDISSHALNIDILGVMYLITKTPNLSSLAIGMGALVSYIRYALNICHAAGKNWTYPINFKDWGLTIQPPPRGSDESMAVQHCMDHLLDAYYKNGAQRLDASSLDEISLDAFAKATMNGSAFKTLTFGLLCQPSDSAVHNISAIVGRSELSSIDIWMKQDFGRVRILESIQWKHLRCLDIHLDPGTFETRVMRALVDVVTKMSEKVFLDRFRFGSGNWPYTPLTLVEGHHLLQTFVVALRPPEELTLHVDMTLEQILLLLKSTDISRLDILVLWAKDFDSVKVDAILEGVGHCKHMRVLHLMHANITDEQIRRMKSKGTALTSRY